MLILTNKALGVVTAISLAVKLGANYYSIRLQHIVLNVTNGKTRYSFATTLHFVAVYVTASPFDDSLIAHY